MLISLVQYLNFFKYIRKYNKQDIKNIWSKIANDINQTFKIHRCGKKCRDRWLNNLNPELNK